MRGMTLKHTQFEYSELFILIHTGELKLIKIKKSFLHFMCIIQGQSLKMQVVLNI